jgi:hypothetical protein
LAQAAVAPIERGLAGPPVYDRKRIAAGLGLKARWGPALQAGYALALATALRRAVPLRFPWNGLAGGALVWGAELIALPATGATPPLRRWPRGQVGTLLLHALAFTLSVAALAQVGSMRPVRR